MMIRTCLLVTLIFAICFSGCQKNGEGQESTTFKGKLVFRGDCGEMMVSVIDGNIKSSKVLAHWENPRTKRSYENVFQIKNNSAVAPKMSSKKEGDTFTFQLNNDAESANFCLAIYVSYNIDKKLSIDLLP